MSYKTIRIYEKDFEMLNELCRKYELSKTEMINAFVSYFKKTGIDPNDPSDVTSEVRKLKNQLISFIKTQEKDKLDPLIKRQNLLINKFLDHLETDGINKEFMTKILSDLGRQIVKKIKE
jgi:hypothetical protein